MGGQRGSDGADEEQHRRQFHHRKATDPVGQPTRGQRTGCRTEQRRRHGEPQGGVVDFEVLLDRGHSAVDHRAVVAEQQPAEGGDRCDAKRTEAGRELLVAIDRGGIVTYRTM